MLLTGVKKESRFSISLDKDKNFNMNKEMIVLDQFVELLKKFTKCLEKESQIISEGMSEGMSDNLVKVFEQKKELSDQMEVKEKISLEALQRLDDEDKKEAIKQVIVDLNDAKNKNFSAILRIQEAITSVKNEVDRIQKRHSLNGLYDDTGKPVNGNFIKKKNVDQSL
jgi:flagellar biosynthesis/type III secretory pathway chaperone